MGLATRRGETGSGEPSERHAIPLGTTVGNLKVERELGHGAFGRVYVARDTLIDRVVALKVLRAETEQISPEERERFLREARVVGALKSAHIATLYHVHPLETGGWMLELEYVEGGSLEDLLGTDVRLPVQSAVRLVRGVLSALETAHEGGVVHGDVKPANVLLDRNGEVKLVDFGLARLLAEERLRRNGEETIAGTPHFMAPEVIMGEPPTAASDIWSVGVLLYRMVGGVLPFAGDDLRTLFFQIQNAPHPALGPEVPAALVRFVDRCLAKSPEERPTNCAELRRLLERVLEPTPAPTAPSSVERAPHGDLVGRAQEVALLRETLSEAARGAGGFVVVTGEAGMGKTALLKRGEGIAREEGFLCLDASVSPGEGLLRPLLRAIRRSAESGEVPPAVFGTAMPAGTPWTTSEFLTTSRTLPAETRPATAGALERLLAAIASHRALAVFIEDAQHADAGEVKLLRGLAHRLRATRTVLVLAARTGAASDARGPVDALTPAGLGVAIPLGPLPIADLRRLVEAKAADVRLGARAADQIARRAGGNPFFALELVRVARESKSGLARDTEGSESDIPRRLRDLLARRLKALPSTTREMLDVAAVDGVEFDGRAIAAVLARPVLAVLRALQRLAREQGIVLPHGRGYRFAPALFQEVVNAELAAELRREIHRGLAEHLEARTDGVDPERVGTHWEGAGSPERARPHLLRAAHAAAARQESGRVVALCRRAGLTPATLQPPETRADVELFFELASALRDVGSTSDDVEAVFDALHSAARATSDATLRAKVLVHRAGYRVFSRGRAPVDDEELRGVAEVLPPSPELAQARYVLGVTAKVRGRLEEAERWLRGADELGRTLGMDALRGSALDQLASVRLRGNRIREAETLYQEAEEACRRAGRSANATISSVNRSLAALARGVLDGLEQRLDEAVATFEVDGLPTFAAHALAHLARVRYAAGNLAGARESVARSLEVLSGREYYPALVEVRLEEGHLAGVAGELDAALSAIEAAKGIAERSGYSSNLALSHAAECQILCFAGERDRATTAASRAIEAADRTTEASVHSGIAMWLAESVLFGLEPTVLVPLVATIRSSRGDATEATGVTLALLEGAFALADGGGSIHALARAAAALGGPGVGPRQAALRVAGLWFAAEAESREDRGALAVERAHEALGRARALGHVWQQAGLARFLARVHPCADHASGLEESLARIARVVGDPRRERTLAAWRA
jgi:tetratricopeptide (TPR) repeat protein